MRQPADRGSASLTTVIVAPIVVVLMFIGFQAAMWNHARTEVRVVAREAGVLVARDGATPAQASAAALHSLSSDGLLSDANVQVARTAASVTVRIEGRAPGLLRGTSAAVSVTVAMPLEGWVPL